MMLLLLPVGGAAAVVDGAGYCKQPPVAGSCAISAVAGCRLLRRSRLTSTDALLMLWVSILSLSVATQTVALRHVQITMSYREYSLVEDHAEHSATTLSSKAAR